MSKTELDSIKKDAIKLSEKERNWYVRHAQKKKITSKSLRVLAIIFIGLGTLCPLIESTRVLDGVLELSRWGYVAFGIGGLFIGYDKFFGMSSGWIRYTLAIMEMNKATTQFDFDWKIKLAEIDEEELNKEQTISFLDLTKIYLNKISNIIHEETKNWAIEFESSLSELRKTNTSSSS